MRTKGTGQLAPRGHSCTSLGRAVRTACGTYRVPCGAPQVAASALLSSAWLCGLRAAAALLVLLLVLHLVLGPPKTQSENRLDGSEVFLRIGGCWRLGGLTQCGWILVWAAAPTRTLSPTHTHSPSHWPLTLTTDPEH